jgi:hypothetical protein
LRELLAPRLDRVATCECRALPGQALGSAQVLFDLPDAGLVESAWRVAVEHLGGAGRIKVLLAGALLPALVQRLPADAVLLGLPRVQRGDLRRGGRRLASALELGLHLGAAAAERLEQRLGQPVDLADAAPDGRKRRPSRRVSSARSWAW